MADDNLVLGRGKVFFAPYAKGTTTGGTRAFLGNCPNFSLAQANTKLDHYRSTGGLKVKDKSITLQTDMTGTIDCDNISLGNMALWFGGNDTDAEPSDAPTDLGDLVLIGKATPIFGQIVFEQDNPEGDNNSYWFPYVSIIPSGNLAMIGDTWQQMSFSVEALKRDDDTERMYVYANADGSSTAITDASPDMTVANVAVAGDVADVATGGTVVAPGALAHVLTDFHVTWTMTGGTRGWLRLHDGSAGYGAIIPISGTAGDAGPFIAALADTYTVKLYDTPTAGGSPLATSGNIVVSA